MARTVLQFNPQRVYIPSSNTDHELDFGSVLSSDDFNGTILIDNISAPVRFNMNGAVDANFSGVYTTTDKPIFDARRSQNADPVLHYYGASGTSFQVTILNA